MTILAIVVAALLGGLSHFALHPLAVGAGGPSAAIPASHGVGGGMTVYDVIGGGPTV